MELGISNLTFSDFENHSFWKLSEIKFPLLAINEKCFALRSSKLPEIFCGFLPRERDIWMNSIQTAFFCEETQADGFLPEKKISEKHFKKKEVSIKETPQQKSLVVHIGRG
eukprot:GHVP01008235.1.p2 GENE.GHVP01008235.1~~GHVP01008235.1.p2  ORF type:complete len:111 (+),score=27.58 GHVP01008235.1:755-1087(+)